MEAAKQSLVLLKNDNSTVPANLSTLKYIVLTGERDIHEQYNGYFMDTVYTDYNNTGAQCGGWTLRWQGFMGNDFWQGENKVTSGAMTILDSVLKRASSNVTVYYNTYNNFTNFTEINETRAL